MERSKPPAEHLIKMKTMTNVNAPHARLASVPTRRTTVVATVIRQAIERWENEGGQSLAVPSPQSGERPQTTGPGKNSDSQPSREEARR